jgi:hypothetical protein
MNPPRDGKKSHLKRILIIAGITILAAPFLVGAFAAFFGAQRADYGWDPAIAAPTYTSSHPRVIIDQAHCNASTAGFTGRYWPFARLIRADGYEVQKGESAFAPGSLDVAQVLVIANAAGTSKHQIFGINIPIPNDSHRKSGDPAFTTEEIRIVHDWVEQGGSLLLIADHAPFGAAAAGLAEAFGVKMHKGFVEVPDELSDPLMFSRDNGRLGDHPILSGEGPESVISHVMTFTGQSLDGPADASVLLRLPNSAVEYVPVGDELNPEPAGTAQGLALGFGKGRVVVLGEAAMLTAQVNERKPFGMNTPGNDNRQLALNIMHWLSRRL